MTEQLSVQERRRIETGIQCPECWGVSIDTRWNRVGSRDGFQCTDCGCQWSRPMDMTRIPDSCPDDLKAKIEEVVADVYRKHVPAQKVSEETKKFIRDRIGRIQFASAGATRKR